MSLPVSLLVLSVYVCNSRPLPRLPRWDFQAGSRFILVRLRRMHALPPRYRYPSFSSEAWLAPLPATPRSSSPYESYTMRALLRKMTLELVNPMLLPTTLHVQYRAHSRNAKTRVEVNSRSKLQQCKADLQQCWPLRYLQRPDGTSSVSKVSCRKVLRCDGG